MAFYDKRKILALLLHVIAIVLVLDILGVGQLINHPLVISAGLLAYYDLWIKR